MIFAILLLAAIAVILMLFVAGLMDENRAYRATLADLGHHEEILRIKKLVMTGRL